MFHKRLFTSIGDEQCRSVSLNPKTSGNFQPAELILTPFCLLLFLQQIPGWWIWYYYLSPVAWTLYGLITSQLGDVQDSFYTPGGGPPVPVEQFIRTYFGYHYNLLGLCAAVLIGFVFLFWFGFAMANKILNFQKR